MDMTEIMTTDRTHSTKRRVLRARLKRAFFLRNQQHARIGPGGRETGPMEHSISRD